MATNKKPPAPPELTAYDFTCFFKDQGRRRMAKITAEERSELGRQAALKRWADPEQRARQKMSDAELQDKVGDDALIARLKNRYRRITMITEKYIPWNREFQRLRGFTPDGRRPRDA